MAQNGADGPTLSFDAFAGSTKRGENKNESSAPSFQDEYQRMMASRFAQNGKSQDSFMLASASSDSGGTSGGSNGASFLNYVGYMTYAGLAASAFGHDDPLQIQTRAMRFFQEKILHHHAIDNPHVWQAMGDALMIEQHLASQGAKFKPVKLKTMEKEARHESSEEKRQGKALESESRDAQAIINDISAGVKSPDDYILAARYMYLEAIHKADERGNKESKDHQDEKRALSRLNLLSGDPDRTSSIQSRDNSVNPVLDELGARVSYRLDAATMLDRYGSHVPELGWTQEAAQLRSEAQAIYDEPGALSEPVRRRLQQQYPGVLVDKPDLFQKL